MIYKTNSQFTTGKMLRQTYGSISGD